MNSLLNGFSAWMGTVADRTTSANYTTEERQASGQSISTHARPGV